MPISEFQQSQVSKLFDKYFPGSDQWSRDEFIHKLADVLSFKAENAMQADLYTLANDYTYVIEEFYKNDRKVLAIKFLRQVGRGRCSYSPSLYDTKKVIDHMWSKFNNSPADV